MKRVSPCPITKSPSKRVAALKQTAPLQAEFPGLSQPALRALVAAGVTNLTDLSRVTEPELAALHSMGPKAFGLLRTALK
jgi:hypothetical protein